MYTINNLRRVVLMPPGLREVLGELCLPNSHRFKLIVEQCEPGRAGSLVDCAKVFLCHIFYGETELMRRQLLLNPYTCLIGGSDSIDDG
jgi:hypothetical protein